MSKPRTDMPPLDFTDDAVSEWVDKVLKQHPEIISGGLVLPSDFSPSGLKRMKRGEIDMPGIRPGRPRATKKIDWEAWYLYYNLCILGGLRIGYEDIALLIDRSPITVKQRFILLGNMFKY